jgi:hypothetical protein
MVIIEIVQGKISCKEVFFICPIYSILFSVFSSSLAGGIQELSARKEKQVEGLVPISFISVLALSVNLSTFII